MTEIASPRPKLELSATGVVAGALASVTSAVLGSQLGTADTLVGAALGSTIGAVATAIYAFGLKSTTHRITTVASRYRSVAPETEADLDQKLEDKLDEVDAAAPVLPERTPVSTRRRVTRWTIAGVVASAVAAFVLALGFITGLESATGTSLSGTSGTTVSHVAQGGQSDADAAATTTEATAEPSAATTPAATASATASATPEASASPTAEATPTATPTATSTPTTTATTQAASDTSATAEPTVH